MRRGSKFGRDGDRTQAVEESLDLLALRGDLCPADRRRIEIVGLIW
jgi:hypothetical protein